MKVLLTGSHGFLGSALARRMDAQGHEVIRLTRPGSSRGPRDLEWNPDAGQLDPAGLEGLEAVVHLAGESLGAGRWTAARRRRILESRTRGTELLAGALATLPHPPAVLVSASAVGYYGDRGDELLEESAPPGRGFLPEVCQRWEAAAAPAAARGIRVVHARLGLVLARDGGALPRFMAPFRWGVGGPLGTGRQYVSWITREDAVAALEWLAVSPEARGPVNVASPAPARNIQFARALGRQLRRPAWLPAPAFALRLGLGAQRADELLFFSQRVVPRRLLELRFAFRDPTLEGALRRIL